MQDILQANPKGTIDIVFGSCGETAIGAIQAIKDADRLDECDVIGLDGQKEELEAIRAGEMIATWQYMPAGDLGFEYAVKVLKGEEVPKTVHVKSHKITKENVDSFKPSF